MVVQPNPVTKDGKAGVQVGELVRVTKTGFESLHRTPHELFKAGQTILIAKRARIGGAPHRAPASRHTKREDRRQAD